MKDFLAKIKEFIKTPLGKVAVAGVALLAILFASALVVGIFIIFTNLTGAPQEVSKVPVRIEKAETETSTARSSEETSTAESQSDGTFKIDEYKDPFRPRIQAETTGTATGTTTSTGTGTTTTSGGQTATSSGGTEGGAKVLEVQDIFNENGVDYASIKYIATVYKVKEGDRVDESPYQVLTIGSDSVVLLYGDRRIEVSEGETILK